MLGGGVTGLETATVFRNLGAKVTIIEVSDHLIPRIDSEFSDELERLMRHMAWKYIKKVCRSGLPATKKAYAVNLSARRVRSVYMRRHY